ncbi:hypothetical protein JMUB7494_27610 [Staphylococcus aureus]
MKKNKYIIVVFVLKLNVIYGCSLEGIGSKRKKKDEKNKE